MEHAVNIRLYLKKRTTTDQEELDWFKGFFAHLWQYGIRVANQPIGARWEDDLGHAGTLDSYIAEQIAYPRSIVCHPWLADAAVTMWVMPGNRSTTPFFNGIAIDAALGTFADYPAQELPPQQSYAVGGQANFEMLLHLVRAISDYTSIVYGYGYKATLNDYNPDIDEHEIITPLSQGQVPPLAHVPGLHLFHYYGPSFVAPALFNKLNSQGPLRLEQMRDGSLFAINLTEFMAIEIVRGQAEIDHALYYINVARNRAVDRGQRRDAIVYARHALQHAQAILQPLQKRYSFPGHSVEISTDLLLAAQGYSAQIEQLARDLGKR